jgi:hypothetical protein
VKLVVEQSRASRNLPSTKQVAGKVPVEGASTSWRNAAQAGSTVPAQRRNVIRIEIKSFVAAAVLE